MVVSPARDANFHFFIFSDFPKFAFRLRETTITFELDFTDLPEQFRHYITVKAARIFSNRFLGSREIEGFALRDEIEAKARAVDSDAEASDRTIFDNYSVLRVLDR